MKRSELEKKLKRLGWYFLKHGGSHDFWTNGDDIEPIPRHPKIHELLANKILRRAEKSKQRRE